MMKLHSSNTPLNCDWNVSFSLRIVAVVWSMPKSKTSSLRIFRICMLFSQSASDCLLSSTISGTKFGHSSGHSRLTISTRVMFIFESRVLVSLSIWPFWQMVMIKLITYPFIPSSAAG